MIFLAMENAMAHLVRHDLPLGDFHGCEQKVFYKTADDDRRGFVLRPRMISPRTTKVDYERTNGPFDHEQDVTPCSSIKDFPNNLLSGDRTLQLNILHG